MHPIRSFTTEFQTTYVTAKYFLHHVLLDPGATPRLNQTEYFQQVKTLSGSPVVGCMCDRATLFGESDPDIVHSKQHLTTFQSPPPPFHPSFCHIWLFFYSQITHITSASGNYDQYFLYLKLSSPAHLLSLTPACPGALRPFTSPS